MVVDVGNTQTHFGTYLGTELVEHWRFATVRESTADELGAALRSLLELRGMLPKPLGPYSPINAWGAVTATVLLTAVLLRSSLESLERMNARAEQSARPR